ncbi:MAG: transporter substrate-binding domain-containing protein [Moritella sp.]|nr:transporter substrate-binding domain-containing protein [Moritella sp.]
MPVGDMTMRIKEVIITLLLVLLSGCSEQSDEKTVHLLYGDYPPYYGKSLVNSGPISEIIVESYKLMGYKVKLQYIPSWAASFKMLRQGQYDGLYSAWYRKEREQWFAFSAPMPPNEIGFFKHKNDNISFKTLSDLKPYSVGVILGYSNAPEFEKAQLKIEAVQNDQQNMSRLIMKRIDLAYIDRGVAQYILENEYPDFMDKLEWIPPAIEIANQHIIFSRKADRFQQKLDDFNKGLQMLTEQGRVKIIMQKHGIQKYDFASSRQ